MITKMRRDRFGALCCARSEQATSIAPAAYPAYAAMTVFGGGNGVSLHLRGTLITAPQTTQDRIVRQSAALHERSP